MLSNHEEKRISGGRGIQEGLLHHDRALDQIRTSIHLISPQEEYPWRKIERVAFEITDTRSQTNAGRTRR